MLTPAYLISTVSALLFSLFGALFFAVLFAFIALAIFGTACRNAT